MGLFKALHDAFFHTVSTKERNHFSKFRSMLISREGYAERHVDLLAFQFVAFLDCFEDPFDAVVVQFIQAMEAFDEAFMTRGTVSSLRTETASSFSKSKSSVK